MFQTNLPFCGVNIDIDFGWRAGEVDDRQRVAPVHQACPVPSANRLQKGACGYGTLVDEHVNVIAFPSRDVRCADPPAPSFITRSVIISRRVL